jgi:hypothetical protein
MKKLAILLAFAVLSIIGAYCQVSAQRPKILGIDHVSFYTTAPDAVKNLYVNILALASAEPVEAENMRYIVGKQWIGYSPAPDPKASDRMDHVAFATDNIVALQKYLTANGIKFQRLRNGPIITGISSSKIPKGTASSS